jgi:hypothetical protein
MILAPTLNWRDTIDSGLLAAVHEFTEDCRTHASFTASVTCAIATTRFRDQTRYAVLRSLHLRIQSEASYLQSRRKGLAPPEVMDDNHVLI